MKNYLAQGNRRTYPVIGRVHHDQTGCGAIVAYSSSNRSASSSTVTSQMRSKGRPFPPLHCILESFLGIHVVLCRGERSASQKNRNQRRHEIYLDFIWLRSRAGAAFRRLFKNHWRTKCVVLHPRSENVASRSFLEFSRTAYGLAFLLCVLISSAVHEVTRKPVQKKRDAQCEVFWSRISWKSPISTNRGRLQISEVEAIV